MQTWMIYHQMATPIRYLSLLWMMRLIRQKSLQSSFFRTFRTNIITTSIRDSRIRIKNKIRIKVSKMKRVNQIRISSKMKRVGKMKRVRKMKMVRKIIIRVSKMKRVSKTHGNWHPRTRSRTTKGGLPGIPLHPLKLR
jgi:hypothetical protein